MALYEHSPRLVMLRRGLVIFMGHGWVISSQRKTGYNYIYTPCSQILFVVILCSNGMAMFSALLVLCLSVDSSHKEPVMWSFEVFFAGRLNKLLSYRWFETPWLSRDVFPVRFSLQWRHNERYGVSSHQPHDCLLKRVCRCRSKKASKHRVTGLCSTKGQ